MRFLCTCHNFNDYMNIMTIQSIFCVYNIISLCTQTNYIIVIFFGGGGGGGHYDCSLLKILPSFLDSTFNNE